MFVKMPTRKNSIASTQQNLIPLRRSSRLQQKPNSVTHNSNSTTNSLKSSSNRSLSSKPRVITKKILKNERRMTREIVDSSKSVRLGNNVDGFSCLRRSPRFSNKETTNKSFVQGKEAVLGLMKAKVSVNPCQQVVENNGIKLGVNEVSSVRRSPRFSCKTNTENLLSNVESVVKVDEKKVRNCDKGDTDIVVKRKRERNEMSDSVCNGWTKEEEVALQRAYFAVVPTPHFWKKVAKLVPGKSANDCFNKVHSEQSTPRQAQPRSRANKLKSSPLGNFSLSASKLLKPTDWNANKNKRSYSKKKSHPGQRTVRHLLRKHYNVDQDREADLFSVLEPNIESSTKKLTQNILFSTPKHKMGKSGLLQRFNDRSSSSRKKSLSRFSNLCLIPVPLVSPPVLKQVKNRVLHDKYIDHLHIRDAKRKVTSRRNATSISSLKSMHAHSQKIDVVRASVVSNAKDVINQFKHLHANDSVNSSDDDDDRVGTDTDDELEDAT